MSLQTSFKYVSNDKWLLNSKWKVDSTGNDVLQIVLYWFISWVSTILRKNNVKPKIILFQSKDQIKHNLVLIMLCLKKNVTRLNRIRRCVCCCDTALLVTDTLYCCVVGWCEPLGSTALWRRQTKSAKPVSRDSRQPPRGHRFGVYFRQIWPESGGI